MSENTKSIMQMAKGAFLERIDYEMAKIMDNILDAKIPDEPVEATVTPHKVGDGGILAMPLKANIPDPQRDDWKLTTCPICGAECWETDLARWAMAAEPELRAACTTCALKAGLITQKE